MSIWSVACKNDNFAYPYFLIRSSDPYFYFVFLFMEVNTTIFTIQSTFVISKSKEPSETRRDIRTSTYQMCCIEENTNRTTKFHK